MFEIKDYDKVEMASFLGHDSLLQIYIKNNFTCMYIYSEVYKSQ